MDDLRRRMEALGERGEPRGAARVLAAARRDSGGSGGRRARLLTALAITASVTLVGGVAAAVLGTNEDDAPAHETAAPTTPESTTTTEPEATTTTAAPAPTTTEVPVSAAVVKASRLVQFNTCGQYLSYVKTKAALVVTQFGLPEMYPRFGPPPPPPTTSAPGQQAGAAQVLGTGSGGGGGEFSQTNVQEAGIDEPDVMKTDGRTIFTVDSASNLRAVAPGNNPHVLSTLPVPGAQQMFLIGDRVVILGYSTGDGVGPKAMIAVVDVARPSAMRLLSRMDVDGYILSARLVRGVPRVVIQGSPEVQWSAPDDYQDPASVEGARSRNREFVARSGLADWLPNFKMTEGPRKGRTGQLTSCSAAYHPPGFAGFATLSVMTLNIDDPTRSHASSVVADGQIVYGSANRIYVATSRWGEIRADGSASPASETLIHEFDITDPTEAAYRVSGKVRGVALNQFSLSEDDGYLRVATSDPNFGAESFVSVLQDVGKALIQVGQVGGLGKGEQIRSVRFIGKTAYVVTFRQIDPLYVVDVSDPRKPVVRGELKLLGYSAYLHPIGDGLLLGVGVDANEEGRRAGLAVNLFDVSDPSTPKLVQHRGLGAGFSDIEFDHHAFLWWPATKLMMVPIVSYDAQYNPDFVGAIGLRIDRSAVDEVGRVKPPFKSGYPAPVQRTIVIGAHVYSLSSSGVMQSALNDLHPEAFVQY